MIRNPFGQFRDECNKVLSSSLSFTFPHIHLDAPALEVPPNLSFGDLASSIGFELAKPTKLTPREAASRLVDEAKIESSTFLKHITIGGAGYINFHADKTKLTTITLENTEKLDSLYGIIPTDQPIRVIVEHTSVNPGGPIHVGSGRNSIIGDSLARILKARGHEVSRHFYVDDVGRQIAVMSYGYKQLNRPTPTGKPDHWIGLVYADTSSILETKKLRNEIQKLESEDTDKTELDNIRERLEDWESAATDLKTRNPELYQVLLESIENDIEPEERIAEIMRKYEANDAETRELVRSVVDLCLEGFRETYDQLSIQWDSWDWESDLVWNKMVSDAVDRLRKTKHSTFSKGALALNVDQAAQDLDLKNLFGVVKGHEIPNMILIRSDGTTLYTTRDIAYTLWKFEHADKIINVIGSEQALSQLQLKIAVSLLMNPENVKNLIHYSYEIVDLTGYKMSRRRGRYITLDEVLSEAINRAHDEVEKRSPHLSTEKKTEIARIVGIGAVKYSLISVVPQKKVTFTWDRVLNFEVNSAPFIQYAHARACSILEKAEKTDIKPDYSQLKNPIEWQIILKVSRFPTVFINATKNLSPVLISEYANELASKFNSFYASIPVLKADTNNVIDARLMLVNGVRITLRNALMLLGIEAPKTM